MCILKMNPDLGKKGDHAWARWRDKAQGEEF